MLNQKLYNLKLTLDVNGNKKVSELEHCKWTFLFPEKGKVLFSTKKKIK
jgi:hypothetical protein